MHINKPLYQMNLGDMMGKLQQLQSSMATMRDNLDAAEVSVESNNVTVVATGSKRVKSIRLAPTLSGTSHDELEDLITVAVNRALEAAEVKGREAMAHATEGLLPPGFDPSRLGL